MTIAERKLESELKELKEKIVNHYRAYINNLNEELNNKISYIKADYMSENGEDIYIPYEDLKDSFFSGKYALRDTIEAFYDSFPDYEFESEYELDEAFDTVREEMVNELKDDDHEDKVYAYDKLRELTQAYQLSDSQFHQTEILNLLEDEFGLSLIVAPAKNQ